MVMSGEYELGRPERQDSLPNHTKPFTSSTPPRRWRYATFSLIVVCILQLLLLPWGSRSCLPNSYETGFGTDFDDAKPHIRLEERRFVSPIRATENGTLYRLEPGVSKAEYRHYTGGDSVEEVDAAWHDLIRERYFVFDNIEVQRLNEDPFPLAVKPLEEMDENIIVHQTGVYGGVDMLHSLHCLDVLRRRVTTRQHPGGSDHHHHLPPDIEKMHIDHCIDQLRQTIMCSGDLTPVTLRPVLQTRDDMPLWILLGETEHVSTVDNTNLIYEGDEEPEFHARTWFALAAMFLLNMVQVFGLLGPPSALSYIEADLDNPAAGTWVPNALSVVQAVLAPLIASLSDTFQARKFVLVAASAISVIGAAIAPGSTSVYRLIVAQILIGFGFATVPLAYCIPSEILPRKWRPMAQAGMNIAAGLGATSGPLIIGALTKANPLDGWRKFYWVQMALWIATTLGLLIGYSPPKRHTMFDHLTLRQKIARLDLIGFFLLSSGIALFLTGMNLGGGLYPWKSTPTLATLVLGILTLVAFGLYEWKATATGILHHDLFRNGHTFAICIGLIFVEGILLFAYVIFYPIMISTLFETDPFLQSVRQLPYWIASSCGTILYGFWSTKFRTIRAPTMVGYLILTSGMVAFATIQPDDDLSSWFFAALAGFGFGAPLILIIAGVQLSTPHHLIATATAATTCSRAIATAFFTAVATTALDSRLEKIPQYISEEALKGGLPAESMGLFIKEITAKGEANFDGISGITPTIIAAGYAALKQAYADGLRVVFIIAAPFGALACIAAFFLGSMKEVMNYGVDAPVEELHIKHRSKGSV
ncbi:hypothetical protein FE257_011524 [Aspergillus nanangensis]|uniref:Major facilitator superfamily (MFS) profile domain-containing protein n=1 Tax=Aspergillus nanangensis TaxID=2582783 RepID=A0AAD4GQJ0_ASPNN|nr:hypothetical protein FE257_011524 [Aspergillus nanangensis]